MSAATLRRMTAGDVPAVTAVHLTSFPGFFLSFLGPGFLHHLYRGILDDATGIAFVVEERGAIRGFVAGTEQPAGFYRRLLRRRWFLFALASLRPALRRPAIIARLLRALTLSNRTPDDRVATALLMSVAVSPVSQAAGNGGRLLKAFLEEARRRGSLRVVLTTDRLANDSVNRFYVRHGMSITRTFSTREGRAMNEYSIDL
ncbi:MAG: GNAT family N-acetyltransferase [Acidobacteriota bacterium]